LNGCFIALALSAVVVVRAGAAAAEKNRAPAAGPLRVHPDNPRYFTDGMKNAGGGLRAVYLTGSHNWNNLQDTRRRDGRLDRFEY
jgi:hypothetical protein